MGHAGESWKWTFSGQLLVPLELFIVLVLKILLPTDGKCFLRFSELFEWKGNFMICLKKWTQTLKTFLNYLKAFFANNSSSSVITYTLSASNEMLFSFSHCLVCFSSICRCQTSREGNLDSADMESNSSKNSHGRDYWGNQQVSVGVCWTYEATLHEFFRCRVRRRVARIKHRRRATRDEARRQLKARAQKEFRRTSATSNAQTEALRRRKCRLTPCSWAVERLMSQRYRDRANWRFLAARRRPPPISSRVS